MSGRKPLGRLIGAFKTVSTKLIHQAPAKHGLSVWQRGYYEHIVRNDRELDAIQQYIAANQMNWDKDGDNPLLWLAR